jgi:hypothetical protein
MGNVDVDFIDLVLWFLPFVLVHSSIFELHGTLPFDASQYKQGFQEGTGE